MRLHQRQLRVVLGVCILFACALAEADRHTISLQFSFAAATSCEPAKPCVPWDEQLTTFEKELHPIIPQRVIRIALGQNESLRDVSFSKIQVKTMPIQLPTVPRYRPFSLEADPRPDSEVPSYEGGRYPRSWISPVSEQKYRGYKIVSFAIYPMRATSDNTVEYIEDLSFEVLTRRHLFRSNLSRCERRDLEILNASADIRLDEARECSNSPGYLIIGPQSLLSNEGAGALEPFVQRKQAQGFRVFADTLESIAPSKTPAEIRQAIIRRYKNYGVDFVLLVGDGSSIPWKKLPSGVSGSGDPIPSDQYYACLDGDFSNYNTYDWACEVAVGRVPAQSTSQLQAWVAKTLALEDAIADGKIRSALNYGEQMDASTLGGWSLDALKSGSSRTVATVGFPNSISFVKLYDGFNAPKSADDFIASLQNNHYIVNHLGHAFQNYVFRMKDDRIVDLPPLPGFFYSQGCYPNDPDVVNWSQKAVVTPGVGPAAMIANTRYGWYGPGQGNEGPSNVLHRAFWSARFKEGIRQIGRMNHRAKQLAIAGQATSLMRYTALESNLMGDPSLDLGLPSN